MLRWITSSQSLCCLLIAAALSAIFGIGRPAFAATPAEERLRLIGETDAGGYPDDGRQQRPPEAWRVPHPERRVKPDKPADQEQPADKGLDKGGG